MHDLFCLMPLTPCIVAFDGYTIGYTITVIPLSPQHVRILFMHIFLKNALIFRHEDGHVVESSPHFHPTFSIKMIQLDIKLIIFSLIMSTALPTIQTVIMS